VRQDGRRCETETVELYGKQYALIDRGDGGEAEFTARYGKA